MVCDEGYGHLTEYLYVRQIMARALPVWRGEADHPRHQHHPQAHPHPQAQPAAAVPPLHMPAPPLNSARSAVSSMRQMSSPFMRI